MVGYGYTMMNNAGMGNFTDIRQSGIVPFGAGLMALRQMVDVRAADMFFFRKIIHYFFVY